MDAFIADDGESIHVAVSGDGPAIVMLHGWTASHTEWAPLVHALSKDHAVYRWDARAHGGHAPTTGTVPSVQRMAHDLRNFLGHYRLRSPVLVGHSMGVLTIWEYVRTFGTAGLGRLCLIDQSPKLVTDGQWPGGIYGDFDARRADALVEEMRRNFPESVLRLAAYGLNARARRKYDEDARGWRLAREALRKLPPEPLIQAWLTLTAADYRDVLGRIAVPVLLVYGAESNFYGSRTAEYVRNSIPGAQLRIYEGADHSPHQCEPERFVRELLAFVAG